MSYIKTPLNNKDITNLKPGQEVFISGRIYTARDQAHKRLYQAVIKDGKPPLELKGRIIYYCGPTAAPKGKPIGSCGPTTSSRMDEFTPLLLKAGLKGMIGKGFRCKEVLAAIKKNKAVYFLTYAGCGALLAGYVKNKRTAAYQDLGPEAVYELEVLNFPAIVGIDCKGNTIL